ncbi:MAG: glycosyl transferase [Clostridia bacterium]|nr:glycosyl transferase [Clostridia bacterium]
MIIIEWLYNIKKYIKKIYRDYFTENGTYTSLLPDRIYIERLYFKKYGEKLNIRNPHTYIEKINWLKLYDRRDKYTQMVDKYEVRDFVERMIGEDYLIPLLGCWDSVEDIDFSKLPEKFVLKCNHDNGVIIVKDKSNLDITSVKNELNYRMKRDYYKKRREWPYKNVKRKIICEKLIETEDNRVLPEYKFYCFNGEAKIFYVSSGTIDDLRFDFYDINFNHLPIVASKPNSTNTISRPQEFEKMIEIAEKLSVGIPTVRVDLYNVNGKVYFGEMTFSSGGGLRKLAPLEWEEKLGEWTVLPSRKNV